MPRGRLPWLLALLALLAAAAAPHAEGVAVCVARFHLTNASQSEYFNIAEAWLENSSGQRVAELSGRNQSSCWSNSCATYGPQRTADGNEATFCATALGDKKASMSIAFDCGAGVTALRVINRKDYGASRLAAFTLSWLGAAGSVTRAVDMRKKGVGLANYTVSAASGACVGAPVLGALACPQTAEGANCTVGCLSTWVGSVTASCYDGAFSVVSGRCRPAVCWVHIRLTQRTLGPQTYLNVAEVRLVDADTNATIPTLKRNMSSTWQPYGVHFTADNNLTTFAATGMGDRWPAMSLSFNCIEGDPLLKIINRLDFGRDRLAAFSVVYVNASGVEENAIDLKSFPTGLASYDVWLPDPCSVCAGETACYEAEACNGTACISAVAKQDGAFCAESGVAVGVCRAGSCASGCAGMPLAVANATWTCANGTLEGADCSAACGAGFEGSLVAACTNGSYAAPAGECLQTVPPPPGYCRIIIEPAPGSTAPYTLSVAEVTVRAVDTGPQGGAIYSVPHAEVMASLSTAAVGARAALCNDGSASTSCSSAAGDARPTLSVAWNCSAHQIAGVVVTNQPAAAGWAQLTKFQVKAVDPAGATYGAPIPFTEAKGVYIIPDECQGNPPVSLVPAGAKFSCGWSTQRGATCNGTCLAGWQVAAAGSPKAACLSAEEGYSVTGGCEIPEGTACTVLIEPRPDATQPVRLTLADVALLGVNGTIPRSAVQLSLSSSQGAGWEAARCNDGDPATSCAADPADANATLTLRWPCSVYEPRGILVVNRPAADDCGSGAGSCQAFITSFHARALDPSGIDFTPAPMTFASVKPNYTLPDMCDVPVPESLMPAGGSSSAFYCKNIPAGSTCSANCSHGFVGTLTATCGGTQDGYTSVVGNCNIPEGTACTVLIEPRPDATQPVRLTLADVALLDVNGRVPRSAVQLSLSSSQGAGWEAARCNDGDPATSCAADPADANATLTLRWPCSAVDLRGIRVTNRPAADDCGSGAGSCQAFITAFQVRVLDASGADAVTPPMTFTSVKANYTLPDMCMSGPAQGLLPPGGDATRFSCGGSTPAGANCTAPCAVGWDGALTVTCAGADDGWVNVTGTCTGTPCTTQPSQQARAEPFGNCSLPAASGTNCSAACAAGATGAGALASCEGGSWSFSTACALNPCAGNPPQDLWPANTSFSCSETTQPGDTCAGTCPPGQDGLVATCVGGLTGFVISSTCAVPCTTPPPLPDGANTWGNISASSCSLPVSGLGRTACVSSCQGDFAGVHAAVCRNGSWDLTGPYRPVSPAKPFGPAVNVRYAGEVRIPERQLPNPTRWSLGCQDDGQGTWLLAGIEAWVSTNSSSPGAPSFFSGIAAARCNDRPADQNNFALPLPPGAPYTSERVNSSAIEYGYRGCIVRWDATRIVSLTMLPTVGEPVTFGSGLGTTATALMCQPNEHISGFYGSWKPGYIVDLGLLCQRPAPDVRGGCQASAVRLAGVSGQQADAGAGPFANASTATLKQAWGIVSGPGTVGSLVFAERGSHRVRRLTPVSTQDGGVSYSLSNVAGTGAPGFVDGVDGSQAQLNNPTGLAVAGSLIYIADTNNSAIRRLDTSTGRIDVVVGLAHTAGPPVGASEPLSSAALNMPLGVAVDPRSDDVLWIADTGNNALRKVNLTAQTVETPAIDNCTAPSDVHVMADGTVFFCEPRLQRVRRVDGSLVFQLPPGTSRRGPETLASFPGTLLMGEVGNNVGRVRAYTIAANTTTVVMEEAWRNLYSYWGTDALRTVPAGLLYAGPAADGFGSTLIMTTPEHVVRIRVALP